MNSKLFLLSIIVLPIIMQAQLKEIPYSDSNQKLNGLAGVPKTSLKDKPGILILPAWMGIDDHAKGSATQLMDLGYHTFIADIYGEGNKPNNQKEVGQQAGF